MEFSRGYTKFKEKIDFQGFKEKDGKLLEIPGVTVNLIRDPGVKLKKFDILNKGEHCFSGKAQ